jgi:hypothetical protein
MIIEPPNMITVDISQGSYQSLDVFLTDQDNIPLQMADSNVLILIVIKSKDE